MKQKLCAELCLLHGRELGISIIRISPVFDIAIEGLEVLTIIILATIFHINKLADGDISYRCDLCIIFLRQLLSDRRNRASHCRTEQLRSLVLTIQTVQLLGCLQIISIVIYFRCTFVEQLFRILQIAIHCKELNYLQISCLVFFIRTAALLRHRLALSCKIRTILRINRLCTCKKAH